MSLFRLALANLRSSTLSSVVNVLLLALGTGSIAILLLASTQLSSALSKNAAGIDLVIGAKGSPLQLVLAGVYHADIPPGNIPATEIERWQSHPMVASAIPLSLGDSHRGFRIVGTVEEFASLYDGQISKGTIWTQPFEAVIGSRVARSTGMKVGDSFAGVHGLSDAGEAHDDSRYRVVGELGPTDSVLDSLIITSTESVWLMHRDHEPEVHGEASGGHHVEEDGHDDHAVDDYGHDDHHIDEDGHEDNYVDEEGSHHQPVNEGGHDDYKEELHHGDEVTLLLVQLFSPLATLTLPREVNAEAGLQAASPPFEISRLLQIVGIGVSWLNAFATVLVVGAALSIFAALYASLNARRHELAVLRCLGATRAELFYLLFVEGLILTTTGIIVGLAIAHVGMALVGLWLGHEQTVSISGLVWAEAEYLLVGGLLLLGSLTAMLPAWQAYRTEVARTLSAP